MATKFHIVEMVLNFYKNETTQNFEYKILNSVIFFVLIFTFNCLSIEMNKKPYHHLPDGTFRNPEG